MFHIAYPFPHTAEFIVERNINRLKDIREQESYRYIGQAENLRD